MTEILDTSFNRPDDDSDQEVAERANGGCPECWVVDCICQILEQMAVDGLIEFVEIGSGETRELVNIK